MSVCVFVLALGACSEPNDPVTRGRLRYEQCAPCHGAQGEGRHELEAPPIAGLADWYIEGQLEKFRKGVRGAHVKDTPGLRMRPMALTLPRVEDVKAVSAHLAALPRAAAMASGSGLRGQVDAGKAAYAMCAACHGPEGKGNAALFAPQIAGLPAWYIERQLMNFREGIRGAHVDDKTGQSMRPFALALRDAEAVRAVAAYAGSL